MEKLAKFLTTYLLKSNIITQEKSPIYQYGFQIGIEVCINTAISIIIAVCLNMEFETIIFFYVFQMLRSHAGGLHLNSYYVCVICSSGSLLCLLLLVKYFNVEVIVSKLAIWISAIIIYKMAPIEDRNRPLTKQERQYFKKMLKYSIAKILIMSFIFGTLKLKRLLFMIATTTVFTVIILMLGKMRYRAEVYQK